MKLQNIREHLLPAPESDPKLRSYMRRLSFPGLQTVAIVEIAAPLLMECGRLALAPEEGSPERLWQFAAVIAVGLVTLAVSRFDWARNHARLLAALSAWVAPGALFWTALWRPAGYLAADDYVLAGITLVMLTVVATVPFRPWHTVLLGLSILTMYFLSCTLALKWEVPSVPGHSDAHYVFLLMLTLLSTGITASNYQHRRAEFAAAQDAIRSAEALTGAQMRAQLAESAISIGKMAAALSHELNSPLGALRSSVETLLILTDRQVDAPPEKRAQLAESRTALRQSIQESTTRIEEVTHRLRRFVSLEEAELKSADLNDLLADVTLLHESQLQAHGVQIEFDFEKPLPALTCRPQLLTAAFSSLLNNAIQAVNGDGQVGISTRRRDLEIEVTIRDNGRGMSPEKVETIFDPSFKVAGSRVSSGNWSLFNARQIVYEHGGDIRVETAEGKGTAMHVTLPVLPVA